MRAIIESGGMQFPVEDQAVIKVPKLEAEVGAKINFDKVMLVSGPNSFSMGKPYVSGAKIVGEVVSHGREDKIIVFKIKKRRKYRRTRGHRQDYTAVKIVSISA
jgi:large subunit ribosomal protein L21